MHLLISEELNEFKASQLYDEVRNMDGSLSDCLLVQILDNLYNLLENAINMLIVLLGTLEQCELMLLRLLLRIAGDLRL